MTELKSLVKDTAIYGVSSIVGKFLNYFLVPLYTFYIPAESGGYGITTNIYALVGLFNVLLTFGMETGFFRFANKGDDDPQKVYSASLLAVGSLSFVFLLLTLVFLHPIAGVLGYGDHPWYPGMMLIVLAIDAIQSIPFAYLRYKKRPIKFASLKLFNILLSILLNVLYFVVMGGTDIGAIFLINLICSATILFGLASEFRAFRYCPDRELLKRMIRYSFPVLILGIAGILNQVGDKILFPFLYPGDKEAADVQLGIYSAATKIAMIMAMITQAFRFAYEPFVFGKSRDKDNKQMYAQAMKFFIIFTLFAFLAVMFYLEILRYVIARDYWEGLRVIPVVMIAEIFMGIYFNLSFWYKLTDDTRWGAYFSVIACVVMAGLNVLLVPVYGYIACAWAGFAGYGIAMLLSYFVGQKKYPITYDLRGIGSYVALAVALYLAAEWMPVDNIFLLMTLRTVLLSLFIAYIIRRDLPLSQIPVIHRIIKKKK